MVAAASQAMLLFALFIGRSEIMPETYPLLLVSMRTAFAIFAALCMVGIVASLARGKIREEDDEERKQTAYTSTPDH